MGLLLGHLVAPDIDVLHPVAADELHALAESILGHAPHRVGQAPKVLLLYRTTTLFRKRFTRTFTIEGHGEKNRVEVLAQGQQAVAYAVHPDTGQRYTWPNPNSQPLTVPLDALGEVDEARIDAFLEAADGVLARYGTPAQTKKQSGASLNLGSGVDIAELVETIRAGGGHWEDNCTRLVGKLIHLCMDEDTIVVLFAEKLTLTGYTAKQTEWSLRKMYQSLMRRKQAKAEEASAKQSQQDADNAAAGEDSVSSTHTSTHTPVRGRGGFGGPGDAEDEEKPGNAKLTDEEKARASARRAAFRGETETTAEQRIRKQWPKVEHPEDIVKKAFAWFLKNTPGKLITLGYLTKYVTTMASLNERYALLSVANNAAVIILREDAMPIGMADFRLRLASEVVLVGVNDFGDPVYKDADDVWIASHGRHVYRKLAFTSDQVSPETMNLFKGSAARPSRAPAR